MKALTEHEIRGAMVNAEPGEAERMPLPGLHEVIWDEREYLGWRDPSSPQRGYLVAWRDGTPVGVVLRAAGVPLRPGSAMCSLCQTPQPAGQVTMFSAARAGDAGRKGDTVATYICADLACSIMIRIAPTTTPLHPDPAQVVAMRAEGLASRLHSFVGRVLEAA